MTLNLMTSWIINRFLATHPHASLKFLLKVITEGFDILLIETKKKDLAQSPRGQKG